MELLSWILVKPETLLFCKKDLIDTLQTNGFTIIKRKGILKLSDLSRILYKNATSAESDLYKYFFKQIFADYAEYAEIWYLQNDINISILEQYKLLNKMKKNFRKTHWKYNISINVKNGVEQMEYAYAYFHASDANYEDIKNESKLIEQYANIDLE